MGHVADWLHNLAEFAVADLDGFDEERFWELYETYVKHFPGPPWDELRRGFESEIRGDAGMNAGSKSLKGAE